MSFYPVKSGTDIHSFKNQEKRIRHCLIKGGIVINTLLSDYLATLEPETAENATKALSKRYCYTLRDAIGRKKGAVTMCEAEFIEESMKAGKLPGTRIIRTCVICQPFQCDNDDLCKRGKAIYCLADDAAASQISDAGYEFANYLITSGLITVDPAKIKPSVKVTQDEPETEMPPYELLEELTSENDFIEWLRKAVSIYGAKGNQEAERFSILKEIFLDITGRYDDNAKSLLIIIDNIENPICRQELIKRLTNENKASIMAFQHITGIKLAKTLKDRSVQLAKITKADYAPHPTPYKSKLTADQEAYNDTFYIASENRDKSVAFIESRGRKWKYRDLDFFIQRQGAGLYMATEGKTGFKIAANCTSIEELQAAVKNKADADGFNKKIDGIVEKNGISPLYKDGNV